MCGYVDRNDCCRRFARGDPVGATLHQAFIGATNLSVLDIPPLSTCCHWQVLTPGQRKFMDALCVEPRFVSLTQGNGVDAPILGTLGAPAAAGMLKDKDG